MQECQILNARMCTLQILKMYTTSTYNSTQATYITKDSLKHVRFKLQLELQFVLLVLLNMSMLLGYFID